MTINSKRFNVRIYAICINSRNEILLSKESYSNLSFVKFPGGGLEWGEGSIDCLKREFVEEFNLKIEVGSLFYFTDFFQVSAFSSNDQVLSVYYKIDASLNELDALIVSDQTVEKLFWVSLSELTSDHVTFPIDKKVVELVLD